MSYWPYRLGWVDPVMFIESMCHTIDSTCNMGGYPMRVALYDMKMRMIGNFRHDLTVQPNDLRWWWEDQYYNYYRNWFYVVEPGGHVHWYEGEVGISKTYFNTRYVRYADADTQAWSNWKQVVVFWD
jgi:hypothetical protein